jgi:hypothetical protein
MRDSENPDLFPMQERKAVDVYARRLARNSVLSDVAAVAAVDALAGRAPAAPLPDVGSRGSAPLARTDRGREQGDADQDERGQQEHGHTDPIPGADGP